MPEMRLEEENRSFVCFERKMKCIECGSVEDVKIVASTQISVDCDCGVCGRTYRIPKVPVGKKDVRIYSAKIAERLLQHEYFIVEARGADIPQMLIVIGFFVEKDKKARIEDVDVDFKLDLTYSPP